ncbi:MAG: hypothetical protein J6B07_07705 [Opitutales bacterium]|nr:hypothetical protein [Opitutales bacterium]
MNKIKEILIFVGLTTFASVSFGQSLSSGSLFDEILFNWSNSISVESMYGYRAKSDMSKGLDGDFSSQSVGATIKIQGVSKSKKHALTSYVNYSYLDADFDSVNSPFSEINTLSASTLYFYNFDSRWSAFGMGQISFSAEDTSNWDDGMQGYFGAGAMYSFSEKFRLGFGACAYSRIDRSWLGFPIVFIDWKITDNLSLRTFSGIALLYDVCGNEKLVLDTSIEYKNKYSRLDEGASVRDEYGEWTVGVTYKPIKNFYIGAHVGFDFGRELDFKKSTQQDIEIDVAPVFYLNVGFIL